MLDESLALQRLAFGPSSAPQAAYQNSVAARAGRLLLLCPSGRPPMWRCTHILPLTQCLA